MLIVDLGILLIAGVTSYHLIKKLNKPKPWIDPSKVCICKHGINEHNSLGCNRRFNVLLPCRCLKFISSEPEI